MLFTKGQKTAYLLIIYLVSVLIFLVSLMVGTWRPQWATWLWFTLLIPAVLFVLALRLPIARTGHCPNCDYDLTGNTTGRCPECGEDI